MEISVGAEFSSFYEVKTAIETLESQQQVTYWRRDSRTLKNAQKRGIEVPTDKDIVYYDIQYNCLHGGRNHKSTSTGKRPHQSTYRTGCNAYIHLRYKKDVKKLVVVSLCFDHKHDVSEDTYRFLPKSRRLDHNEQAEVDAILRTKPNPKILQDHIRQSFRKTVTLKDLKNMSAKINNCSDDLEEILTEIRKTPGTCGCIIEYFSVN